MYRNEFNGLFNGDKEELDEAVAFLHLQGMQYTGLPSSIPSEHVYTTHITCTCSPPDVINQLIIYCRCIDQIPFCVIMRSWTLLCCIWQLLFGCMRNVVYGYIGLCGYIGSCHLSS